MRSSCLHRIRGCGNHSCMTECVRYYPKAEPWRHDKGFHKCRKLGYQPVKTAGNVVFPVWAHQCAAGRMSAEASWRRTSGTSSTDKKLAWSRGFRQVDARKNGRLTRLDRIEQQYERRFTHIHGCVLKLRWRMTTTAGRQEYAAKAAYFFMPGKQSKNSNEFAVCCLRKNKGGIEICYIMQVSGADRLLKLY